MTDISSTARVSSARAATSITPVLHLRADVHSDDSHPDRFAQNTVLNWISGVLARHGLSLSTDAWQGVDAPIDYEGRILGETVAYRHGTHAMWAAFVEDPDSGDRSWRTEVAVARDDEAVTLYVRQAVRGRLPADFTPGVPRFVKDLASKRALSADGRRFGAAIPIVSDDDADGLISFISQRGRRLPVVVLSLIDDKELSETVSTLHSKISMDLAGIAHFMLISARASWRLTNLLGKEWSVYNNAIRVYRTGLSLDNDPYRHLLLMPERVEYLKSRGGNKLRDLLRHIAAKENFNQLVLGKNIWSFVDLRVAAIRQSLQRARQDGHAAEELMKEQHDLNTSLEEQIKELEDELDRVRNERDDERQKREEAESKLESLAHHLRKRRENHDAIAPNTSFEERPQHLREVRRWAERQFGGQLVITPRAERGAKDSPYQDVDLAYACLEALASGLS